MARKKSMARMLQSHRNRAHRFGTLPPGLPMRQHWCRLWATKYPRGSLSWRRRNRDCSTIIYSGSLERIQHALVRKTPFYPSSFRCLCATVLYLTRSSPLLVYKVGSTGSSRWSVPCCGFIGRRFRAAYDWLDGSLIYRICRKEEIFFNSSFRTLHLASHFPLPLQPVLLTMSSPSWPAASCFYYIRS